MDRVGIGMNAEADAAVERVSDKAPIDVQTPRIAVDLDHDAALPRPLEHTIEIHRVTLACKQQSAGKVTEKGHLRIVERA